MKSLPLVLCLAASCGLAGPLLAPIPATASEQGVSQEPLLLTNDTVWHLARERAHLVAAARATLDGARADRGASFSPFRPQVQAGMNYRRAGETPTLPNSRHSYQGQATIEQSLLTFGRTWSLHQITSAAIQSANLGIHSAERDAALRALIALDSYRFAKASEGVAQARVDQREGEFADAQKLFEVGNVPMLDVRQTRINLTLAQDALRQAQAVVDSARAELAAALALDGQPFTVYGELQRPGHLDPLISTADSSVDDNIDQRQLDTARNLQQARARYEMVDSMPTVGGVVGYTMAGPRLNDLDDDWYLGVGVQWKLYDGGGRYSRRSSFLAEARRIEAQRDALSDERRRELAVIQAEGAALAARIALQQSVIADSEQNYEDARVLYQTGEITLTRVGEAGLAVIEAKFNLNRYAFEESVLAHRLRAFAE